MDSGDEEVKPSEDPRSPFNHAYQAQINWLPMQKLQNSSNAMTKVLEKARLKDPLHDAKKGLSPIDTLLPKKFHVYSRAGK